MEAMGLRAGLRAGTDLHALGWHTPASRDYMNQLRQGVRQALDVRDKTFGDYRTAGKGATE
jgi:enoyl-CoA hydratase